MGIVEYIDHVLAAGELPTEHPNRRRSCKLCSADWHGRPDSAGCPGAFASAEQEARWWQIIKARNESHRAIARSGTR